MNRNPHITASEIEQAFPRRRIPISSQVVSGLTVGLDSFVILASGAILYLFLINHSYAALGNYATAVGYVWIMTILLLRFAGLYQFEAILKPVAHFSRLVVSFATAFLFLLAAAFSFKISTDLSRVWTAAFAAGSCGATLFARIVLSQVVLRLSSLRVFTRNVIVIGSGEQSERLLAHMRQLGPSFVSVLGVFTEDEKARGSFCGYPVLGTLNDVDAFARRVRVDDAIIALPWAAEDLILSVLSRLRELPLTVHLGADLVGFRLSSREPAGHFGDIPVREVMGQPLSGWSIALKAAEDYALASIGIIALMPLMAAIALAVKLESPGPVLFRQDRLGFNNRKFTIYKFRTMRHSSDPHLKTIQATPHDPRVTRLGRFLRRSSLDELPQLFNVLNGTMSLVGPRPHAVDHNEHYAQQVRWYFARHRVKPGITGWAQVRGFRGRTDTPEKMEARVKHDIEYAENWSLVFDLHILARTLLIVLTARNAY